MMAYFARTAVVATLLAAVISQARAETPASASPARGMLLLRNGETIEGTITREDGLYIVDLPNGRIRVKAADVDLVCSSLEEGYRRKRAAIQVGNVHDHLDLAQWCLRHNLIGFATVELADATVAEPKNPMIAVLQHRLKMAMEPPPPAEPRSPSAAGPSNDELDRMIRGMPRGVVETFTQSVQPVLLNHCATSGCHGPQSTTGLRLCRVPAGRSSTRRTTQRNLYSVLQFVNRENPTASKLLTAATKPHGTAQHAIFGEREALQYQRMVDWATLIARPAEAEIPESVARRNPAEVVEPPSADDSPGRPSQEAGKPRLLTASARRRSARDVSTSPKADHEAPPASSDQSGDPFDPEVFNRRYGAKK
jgi:hypothetical protein